jgi:subtilisin family serine protease
MNKLLKLIFLLAYLLVPRVGHTKELRKVVAIVDTGMPPPMINKYLCDMPHYDLTGFGITDHNGHGTNIAFIIANRMNIKTHCLLIIKWWDTEKTSVGSALLAKAVKEYSALLDQIRPAYVNLSLSGEVYISYEANVLKGLVKSGSVVSVAAGNEGRNLDEACISYPACYNISAPNFHVVGARNTATGSIEYYSNRGRIVTDYESGNACTFTQCFSGTSQATAQATARLTSGYITSRVTKRGPND